SRHVAGTRTATTSAWTHSTPSATSEHARVVRLGRASTTRARTATSRSIGAGLRERTARDAVAYQIVGTEPIARLSAQYAWAMAVQTAWQSIRVAMMPPLRMWRGPAA